MNYCDHMTDLLTKVCLKEDDIGLALLQKKLIISS